MKNEAGAKLIDLSRTTPPMPAYLGDLLACTLRELHNYEDVGALLRSQRFLGFERDRTAGAQWLSMRLGVPPDIARIAVTNGTQNTLFILLATLVGRDGLLLTETVTYHGLHAYADLLGLQLKAIGMDSEGARPEEFEHACKCERPKALFLMPTLQNPTTIIMGTQRRLDLAAIARRYGVAIIEDDVYGLLPRDAPPPIAALAPDITYYAAGLAKCVATGLRISYLVTPSAKEMGRITEPFRLMSTWFPAPLPAAVASTWILDGSALRICQAIRAEAAARQEIVARTLRGTNYATQPEALHVWLQPPPPWTTRAFVDGLRRVGVIVQGSYDFSIVPEQAPVAVRIAIGKQQQHSEIEDALALIVATMNSGAANRVDEREPPPAQYAQRSPISTASSAPT